MSVPLTSKRRSQEAGPLTTAKADELANVLNMNVIKDAAKNAIQDANGVMRCVFMGVGISDCSNRKQVVRDWPSALLWTTETSAYGCSEIATLKRVVA